MDNRNNENLRTDAFRRMTHHFLFLHHIYVCMTLKSLFSSFSERMASQTQGIQQLLGAEKRAAEKVFIKTCG